MHNSLYLYYARLSVSKLAIFVFVRLQTSQLKAGSNPLWICCDLRQIVTLQIIRKFSNYSQRNLPLCDSRCNLQLMWMRLYLFHVFLEEPKRKPLVQLDLLLVPFRFERSMMGENIVDHGQDVARALGVVARVVLCRLVNHEVIFSCRFKVTISLK